MRHSTSSIRARRNGDALFTLLCAVATIGLVTLPALEYSGDPFAWREEARTIILRRSLSIDPDIARNFGEPGQYFVLNPNNGGYYSKYGIFSSLLNATPLSIEYFVTGSLPNHGSPTRVLILGVFFVLVSMAIGYALYEITGFYSSNSAARLTYVFACFYTTYLWNYLRSTSAESTLLLGFLLLWLFFLRFNSRDDSVATRPLRDLYGAWCAMAILTQTRIYFLLLIPIFAADLILIASRQRIPRRAWFSFAARAIIVPILLIALALGIVNQVKFGSPFLDGYHQWQDAYHPHTIWTVLYDYVINIQCSILFCFPPVLLALGGIRRFVQAHRREALILLAICVVFLFLFQHQKNWRGEWGYGPRYWAFVLPIVALPALYPLEWMYSRGLQLSSLAAQIAVFAAGAFMIVAQMQVNRLDFFFRYRAQLSIPESHRSVTNDYFNGRSFARINWDHIQADGHLERLPYYEALANTLRPEELADWRTKLTALISRSNLFWFPETTQGGSPTRGHVSTNPGP